jgi:hypothetical protein
MRRWTTIVAAFALLLTPACNKKKEANDTLAPMDHVVRTPTPAPRSVLRKTFTVDTYVAFPVDVPIHSHSPSLKGNFASYRYQSTGGRISDDAASIDLLLLDDKQYETFTHGPSEDITRSAQSSHEQAIDWALGATTDLPRKYYLVFNNSTGKPKTKLVDADFTLTFE